MISLRRKKSFVRKGSGAARVITILLPLGILFSAFSNPVLIDASTAEDELQGELNEIEILIEGIRSRIGKIVNAPEIVDSDTPIVIRVIDRLEALRQKYSASPKMDGILFYSGDAKSLLASLAYYASSDQSLAKTYVDKHKDWYKKKYEEMVYNCDDFKKLIKDYPESPFVDSAAYSLAFYQGPPGDCEADMDCHIQIVLKNLLPFIKQYPGSPKVLIALNRINDTFEAMLHPENGDWEIYNIQETEPFLKDYYNALMSLDDKIKHSFNHEEALYKLARAFISVGQYEMADRIYKEMDANRGRPLDTRTRADRLMLDYVEQKTDGLVLSEKELSQYTSMLNDPSENIRLNALDKINHSEIRERPLLFSLLLTLGNLSKKDNSPAVRKQAIDVIGNLAPKTSFFRSAVGYCLLYDHDRQNRYYCALQGIQHPDLKNTGFYAYNSERIESIIVEATGSRATIDQMIAERRNKLLQEARESLKEANDRVAAEGIDLIKFQDDMANKVSEYRVNIFGTEYIIIRKKLRPEVVIPLWAAMMLLSGIYCHRVAEQRNAGRKFWTILGVLTAPISLFFVFIIPRRNKS